MLNNPCQQTALPQRTHLLCVLAFCLGLLQPAVQAQALDKTLAPAPAAAEALTLKRAAPLRDTPLEAGRSLTALTVQTVVTPLGARQGPWIKVRAPDGAIGWVHIFDVTLAQAAATTTTSEPASNLGTSALRGIASFFGKGTQTGVASTSTAGIRGLDAQDLANAQPNMGAVKQLDALRLNAEQARQFADQSSLTPRAVELLPASDAASPSPDSTLK